MAPALARRGKSRLAKAATGEKPDRGMATGKRWSQTVSKSDDDDEYSIQKFPGFHPEYETA
jgi:hypothetical protein